MDSGDRCIDVDSAHADSGYQPPYSNKFPIGTFFVVRFCDKQYCDKGSLFCSVSLSLFT